MPRAPPTAGCGAGSRWFLRGAPGQEGVVGAAGEVPLDSLTRCVPGDPPGEAALVDDGVVPLAQQGGVGKVRGPEVGPVHEVVRVGPGRWGAAAGVGAAAVA